MYTYAFESGYTLLELTAEDFFRQILSIFLGHKHNIVFSTF